MDSERPAEGGSENHGQVDEVVELEEGDIVKVIVEEDEEMYTAVLGCIIDQNTISNRPEGKYGVEIKGQGIWLVPKERLISTGMKVIDGEKM